MARGCRRSRCSRATPWPHRRGSTGAITLLAGEWAFDFGLGIGHVPAPDDAAAGINIEMAVGLTDRVELGVRTGLRFGDGGRPRHRARQLRAPLRPAVLRRRRRALLANPEVRVRGALLRGPVAELGLEGRLIVPVETPTQRRRRVRRAAGAPPGRQRAARHRLLAADRRSTTRRPSALACRSTCGFRSPRASGSAR